MRPRFHNLLETATWLTYSTLHHYLVGWLDHGRAASQNPAIYGSRIHPNFNWTDDWKISAGITLRKSHNTCCKIDYHLSQNQLADNGNFDKLLLSEWEWSEPASLTVGLLSVICCLHLHCILILILNCNTKCILSIKHRIEVPSCLARWKNK